MATLIRTAAVIDPSGSIPLTPDAETVADPASTFTVVLAARVADARLSLFDPQDAHVAATASREVGDATRVTLAPAAPLVPGSRYVLRLDGAVTRELHDAGGRAFAPVSFPVLAAGSPPPAEPKRPARRRR